MDLEQILEQNGPTNLVQNDPTNLLQNGPSNLVKPFATVNILQSDKTFQGSRTLFATLFVELKILCKFSSLVKVHQKRVNVTKRIL